MADELKERWKNIDRISTDKKHYKKQIDLNEKWNGM